MKKFLAIAAASLPLASWAITPIYVDGLSGWMSPSFSYSASPAGASSSLGFSTNAPGTAVIGWSGGPYLAGKTVSLSVSMQASMGSLVTTSQPASFTQTFAAQGSVGIFGLNTDPGLQQLLSGTIASGQIQVDLDTRKAVVELNMTGLTSGGLHLTGQPATLRLEGFLAGPAVLGICADYAYKLTCQPGERFLDDFTLNWSFEGAYGGWSVSPQAFASSVPEAPAVYLMLMGGLVLTGAARRRHHRPRH